MLEGEAARHLTDFIQGAVNLETISPLTELGLIEAGAPECLPPTAASPTSSLLDYRLSGPSLSLLCGSIREQQKARHALTRHSLGALLAPTGLPRASPEACRHVAAAFARASRFRDTTDQCLVRGLAMRAVLARRGLGVDLVIGVMLPFAAHCWIQAGEVLLSDPLDRVRNFTPLLTAQ